MADKWVANSLLQKSIRRGEVEVAEKAALTFLEHGGSAIWRRLLIIAFEDLGAASPEVVAMTVAASTAYEAATAERERLTTVIESLEQAVAACRPRRGENYSVATKQRPRRTQSWRTGSGPTSRRPMRSCWLSSEMLPNRPRRTRRSTRRCRTPSSGSEFKGDRDTKSEPISGPHLVYGLPDDGGRRGSIGRTELSSRRARDP